MSYLFFDTETTGLPKNYNAPSSDVNNWPRMVQLAWQLFSNDGQLIHEFEFIIRPDGFEIPESVSKIHGITNEYAMSKGIDLDHVLSRFKMDLDFYGTEINLAAHNINFDQGVLGAEFIRILGVDPLLNLNKICTMLRTVNYCKIPGSRGGYKWPKLQELYKFVFGENFEEAHNALNDVRAMSKIFWHIKNNKKQEVVK